MKKDQATYEGMDEQTYITSLKARIAASGLSKSQICRDADLAYTTLDRILNGKVSPTLRTMRAIDKAIEAGSTT